MRNDVSTVRVVLVLDRSGAKVFAMHPEGVEEHDVPAPIHHAHGHAHDVDETRLFEAAWKALGDATEVVVLGHGEVRVHFAHWVERKHAAQAGRIVANEAVDQRTDRQLLAHAREVFTRIDRLQGIHVR